MAATHPFTLALIAHDGKKDDMARFAGEHLEELRGVRHVATATTGALLRTELGLDVESMASGPQGGDLQIGARIVDGRIDGVIFFRDPLTSHPHEPDIQAVLKVQLVSLVEGLAVQFDAQPGSVRNLDGAVPDL